MDAKEKGNDMNAEREKRKSILHEILLTFDILVAACIIAGAIVFSAVFAGRNHPAYGSKIRDASVRRQFIEQVKKAVQGAAPNPGRSGLVKRVEITDLRHSATKDQLLIEFNLVIETGPILSHSCILTDDGFARYEGFWAWNGQTVHFVVK